MLRLIVIVNIIYIACYTSYVTDYDARGGWFYSDIMWFMLHSFVTRYTYNAICSALKSGLSADLTLDLFGLNLGA